MADRIFLREVKLSNINKTLLFYQNSVGNVSCVVWDAALVLTKYLEKKTGVNPNWLTDLKVVELGAGLGCVGITAACYGADVILTDLPEVVPQLVKTTELNRTAWSDRGKVRCVQQAWGKPTQDLIGALGQHPDLVLLSDCVYYDESVDPLMETLSSLCKGSSTQVLFCQEKRDIPKQQETLKQFLNKFNDAFVVKKIPVSDQDEVYASPDIYLYSAYKKI